MNLIILSLGRGHLLQVPPGAGEEPSEVQQPDEEQAVVLRVRHLRAVLVLLQEPSREHRAHCENHDIFYVGPMSISSIREPVLHLLNRETQTLYISHRIKPLFR